MGEPPLVPSPIPSFPQPQSSIHPVFFHRDIPHILSSSPAFHSSVPISGSVFDPSGSASGPLAVSPSGTHSIGPLQQVLYGLVSNPSCSAPDPLFEPPSGTQENGSQQAAPGELPPALDGIGPLPGPLAGPLEASQRKMEPTSGIHSLSTGPLSQPGPEIRITTAKPRVATSILTHVNLASPKSIRNSQRRPYIHACQMYTFAELYIYIDNQFKPYKFKSKVYLHISFPI